MTDIVDLLSHTSDGAFAVDAEQRIILWNQAAERLLGFQAGEGVDRAGAGCLLIRSNILAK